MSMADPVLTMPTAEMAMRRLRLDDDLLLDVQDAIPQAHAEAQAYLDGVLYGTEDDRVAAGDDKGVVCTPDIIQAQLLLVDAAVGGNTVKDADAKREVAWKILRRHRNQGA